MIYHLGKNYARDEVLNFNSAAEADAALFDDLVDDWVSFEAESLEDAKNRYDDALNAWQDAQNGVTCADS